MADDIKQTVTRTEERGVTPDGTAVNQQTEHVQTTDKTDARTTAQNLVWYLLGLIEILLAFRFVLKLLGANPSSGFVDFIYNVTNIVTAPFDNIFGVASTTAGEVNSMFEPSILVAAAVYAVIAWAIVKLLNLNRRA